MNLAPELADELRELADEDGEDAPYAKALLAAAGEDGGSNG